MAFLNRSVIISSAFALYVLYQEVNYEECAKLMPDRNTIVVYGKKILKLGFGIGCIGFLYVMYKEQRSQTTIMGKVLENAQQTLDKVTKDLLYTESTHRHLCDIQELTRKIHKLSAFANPTAPYDIRY